MQDFHSQCPLCQASSCNEIDQDAHRKYYRCSQCNLVYVPAAYHLSQTEEKAIYDYHENDPHDAGYRAFLSRLAIPLSQQLPAGAQGIDVGCGPGPTLPIMLREQGFSCDIYDPYYYPDTTLIDHTYDFVTATEVVEHFCAPRVGFDRLFSLLKSGGKLGIMTKTIPQHKRFSHWHYTRDLTHVSFYHASTLEFIAATYQAHLKILRSDVAIFATK